MRFDASGAFLGLVRISSRRHLLQPTLLMVSESHWLALAPGRLLLAHNSSPHSRTALDLSASVDGRTWVLAQALAHGTGADEYSYPAVTWADDSLWLSYTDQRQRIAWQRFAWAAAAH